MNNATMLHQMIQKIKEINDVAPGGSVAKSKSHLGKELG
jgi:hypothetical protein